LICSFVIHRYLKTEVLFKRKLSKADFSTFEYFFNNAVSESRVVKLNALTKWMIIQFYRKVIIIDLCARNKKEKQMHRKKSKTLVFIFRERKRKIILNIYFFMLSF